jgi:hypothetical protein
MHPEVPDANGENSTQYQIMPPLHTLETAVSCGGLQADSLYPIEDEAR